MISITAPEGDAPEQDFLSMQIAPDSTLANLKEYVQAEARILSTSQHFYLNGNLLQDDTKTMAQLQIGDGEMLALRIRDMVGGTGLPAGQQVQQAARQQAPQTGDDPRSEMMRQQLLADPSTLREAQRHQPELAAAINDPQRFAAMLQQLQSRSRDERIARQQELARLNEDPFDVDAQMRIAEIIREERVQENLQNAYEHNPEGMAQKISCIGPQC